MILDQLSESELLGSNAAARFEGVQDLTDEIEITDYTPIFVGTYSHIYKGTCRGQAVSLNDLCSTLDLN